MKKLYSILILGEYANQIELKAYTITNSFQGALNNLKKEYKGKINFWYNNSYGAKIYHIAGTKKTIVVTCLTENEPYFMYDYEYITSNMEKYSIIGDSSWWYCTSYVQWQAKQNNFLRNELKEFAEA